MGGVVGVGVVVLALAGAATLRAHHSVLAYDGDTATTLTGTVTKVLWQNPHAYIALDVAATGTRWMVENEGPVALVRLGWTRSTVSPGDTITIVGARARDGSPRLRCTTVTLADARRLPCFVPAGSGTGEE